MRIPLILVLLISILLADDFSAFEQFDNMDKTNFKKYEQKINNCIKEWKFECAKENLNKIKRYITKKSDNNTISSLWSKLYAEQDKKERYEEAKRRANANKSIELKNCQSASGGARMCSMYVNNRYDGNIFYKLKNDGNYNIFILGSKNAKNNSGFYDTKLHRVWTTYCGDSVFGASKKVHVYDLSKALYMYANCSINGRYQ
jgi:hypothetical protein